MSYFKIQNIPKSSLFCNHGNSINGTCEKIYRYNFKTKQQARLYYCLKQNGYQLLRSPNDGWTSDKPRDCRKLKSIVNEIIKSFLRIRHDSSEIRRRLLRNIFIWDSEMKDFHYSTYFLCSYLHLYYFFICCFVQCLVQVKLQDVKTDVQRCIL